MTGPNAILLVGPTGAGKTPLGELLERRGLWGRPCRHFDFGDRMRRIVAGELPPGALSPRDAEFLRSALQAGALLDDEHFPIAAEILRAFLAEPGPGSGEAITVLNGLPRHVSQAEALGGVVAVRAVIELACTPEVVAARIRTNAGGDRAERSDDDEAAVRHRLEIYRARTAPLLGHYRGRSAAVLTVDVAVGTTADDVRDFLNARPAPPGL